MFFSIFMWLLFVLDDAVVGVRMIDKKLWDKYLDGMKKCCNFVPSMNYKGCFFLPTNIFWTSSNTRFVPMG